MAGRRPDTLKPSLVITCGDAATKKKVTKIFKRQGWLQDLLKTNRIMFLALAAENLLSAGPGSSIASITKLSERYAVQLLPPGATTSCGLGLLRSPTNGHLQHHCTFGGLIMVNGTTMGLTAGHPFSEAERNDVQREPSDVAQITEDSSDDDSGSTSDEPFVFNDADDGGANDKSTESSVSLHKSDEYLSSPVAGPSRARQEMLMALPPSAELYYIQGAILPKPDSHQDLSNEGPLPSHDWALLEKLPSAIASRPNKIAHMDLRHDIPIVGTVPAPACGEVTINIGRLGSQLGQLHASLATMKVDEYVWDVQLITLERGLRK